jgi:hypothetical protein
VRRRRSVAYLPWPIRLSQVATGGGRACDKIDTRRVFLGENYLLRGISRPSGRAGLRPLALPPETFAVAIRNGCPTSTPAVGFAQGAAVAGLGAGSGEIALSRCRRKSTMIGSS